MLKFCAYFSMSAEGIVEIPTPIHTNGKALMLVEKEKARLVFTSLACVRTRFLRIAGIGLVIHAATHAAVTT